LTTHCDRHRLFNLIIVIIVIVFVIIVTIIFEELF